MVKGKSGCKRLNCDYLYIILVRDDGKYVDAHKYFPCDAYKSVFKDKECVVTHVVDNTAFVLCLNRESCIQ